MAVDKPYLSDADFGCSTERHSSRKVDPVTVLAIFKEFKNSFLGTYPNDGAANTASASGKINLAEGLLYWNTTSKKFRAYTIVASVGSWIDYDTTAQEAKVTAIAKALEALNSANASAASATSAALDRAQTGLDRTAVAADRVQTNLDRIATDAAAAEVDALFTEAAAALAAGTVSDLVGTRIYTGRAALDADLVPADGLYALVIGDATAANNDLYRKIGATTVGSWSAPLSLFAAASAEAEAWAQGTEPGGPGTKSALEWAEASEAAYAALGDVIPIGLDLSGYAYQITDSDGHFLFGVRDEADPRFVVTALEELEPDLYPRMSANLGGEVEQYSSVGLDLSGAARLFLAGDGRVLGGISDDPFPQPLGAFDPFRNARPEATGNAAYDLFTRRDANYKMQIYSRKKSNGAVVRLSNPGTDNINPHFDGTGTRAVWSTNVGDRWPSDQLRSRVLGSADGQGHAYPRKFLTTLGDSVANGTGASPSSNAFAYLAATGLSLTMSMVAVGGQQVWQQAMQNGSIPTILTIASTTIAVAGTNVTAIATIHPTSGVTYSCAVAGLSGQSLYPNTLYLSTVADASTRTVYGWVEDSAGEEHYCRLVRTATGVPSTVEAYVLSSFDGADFTAASTTVIFRRDFGDQNNHVMIYEGGINDLSQGLFATNRTPPSASVIMDDVAAVQDAMIAANRSAIQAFCVVGVYNPASATFIAGSAADLAIIAFNANRAAAYPGRFVNAFALLAAGATAPGDNSDVTNRYIPTSLRADTTHPNNAGHAVIANGNSAGLGVIATLQPQLAAMPWS